MDKYHGASPLRGPPSEGPPVALWLPKLMYVVATMANSGWGRYQTLYFNNKGISPSTIGLMRGLGLGTKSISYPFWGLVADWSGSLQIALIGSILASTFALELFRLDWTYSSLWHLLFVQIVRSASNSIWPLVDAFAMAVVANSNSNEGYGQQRLWCAISWGLSALLLGYVIDQTSFNALFYFTYSMVIIEVLLVLCLIPRKTILAKSDNNNNNNKESISLTDTTNIKLFFTKKFITLSSILLFYGIVMSIPESVLFIHLDSHLHMSKTEIGLSLGCSVLLEIPLFYTSQNLLATYGTSSLLYLSQGTTFLRLFLYQFISEELKWTVYLIQVLHGICFAGFWVGVVHLGQRIGPKGLNTTSHALVSAIYATLAQAIGGVLMGWILEEFGFKLVLWTGMLLMGLVLFLTKSLMEMDEVMSDLGDLQIINPTQQV
uniref:Major facilitator superfamily associated domain-containing protein n=1 Tax=Arcella intermedia TaxID=1963864 RepID=A0A6B2L490_9EUKA